MIKNYFLVAFRNIWKNKIYVLINLLGLGIALACSIVAYLNQSFDANWDKFHVNSDKIFKVNCYRDLSGEPIKFGIVPVPTAPSAAREIPEVAEAIRYSATSAGIVRDDELFSARIAYADPGFLKYFSFELLEGDAEALADKKHIFLTEKTAAIHFPDGNALGQPLTLNHSTGQEENFVVAGIIKDFPFNSSIRFGAVTHFENYTKLRDFEPNDWTSLIQVSFLVLENPSRKAEVEQQLQRYVAVQNKASDDWKIASFYLEPFTDTAQLDETVRGFYLAGSLSGAAVVGPTVMAILLLLLACFNFVNTAMAVSVKRLKEIGIRKVMGGLKKHLIIQFLLENVILCLLSLFLALFLAEFFVPAYSQLWNFLELELVYTNNWSLVGFLIGVLLFTGLVAGLYPAWYISRFEPAGILRGTFRLAGTNNFTRVLLTLQFAISVMAVMAGVVFYDNANYQQTLDYGFHKDKLVVIPFDEQSDMEVFKNTMEGNPAITNIGETRHHVYWDFSRTTADINQNQLEIDFMQVGDNYFQTAGMTLLDGRFFTDNSETDRKESAIINEMFAKDFGLTDPVGKTVVIQDSIRLQIVGMVKNFHNRGLWGDVNACILRAAPKDNMRYLILQSNPENVVAINEAARTAWRDTFDGVAYRGFLQEEEMLAEPIQVNNNIKLIFTYLAVIAVLLSVIGLFTLVSLNIQKRMKELGVRKVLGATVVNIAGIINREFILILSISCVLGSAMAYYLVDMLLANIYRYYTDIGPLVILLTVAIVFIASAITIGGKVYRAAVRNPVEALRSE